MVIPILRVCVTTFFLQATTSPQAPHWKRHCDDCVPSKCSPPSSPSLTPHRRMWGAIVTLLFWVSDNLARCLVHLSKAVIRAPFRRRYNPKITSSLQTSHFASALLLNVEILWSKFAIITLWELSLFHCRNRELCRSSRTSGRTANTLVDTLSIILLPDDKHISWTRSSTSTFADPSFNTCSSLSVLTTPAQTTPSTGELFLGCASISWFQVVSESVTEWVIHTCTDKTQYRWAIYWWWHSLQWSWISVQEYMMILDHL